MNDCDAKRCGCKTELDRRTFLAGIGAGAALSALTATGRAVAGPFVDSDFERLVPADKKLDPAWLESLTARGVPTACRGAELATIGMPVGGIGAGQLYLGGDGRLWHWDIFNTPQPGNFANTSGPNYAHPPRPASPLEQGFAVRVTAGGAKVTRVLDQRGIAAEHIEFRGQYPIGRVAYRDPTLPVAVDLEAFSPFIPLHADDSSLPATILEFTLRNTGSEALEVELFGWLENAVCLETTKTASVVRRNQIVRIPGLTMLACSADEPPAAKTRSERPDLAFDDFERPTYEGWQVAGTAFGKGPVLRKDVPDYQGDVGGLGQRVVNSHATAPGGDVGAKDRETGQLTSRAFRIERNFLRMFVGGGGHAHKTCVNLRVDGRVVRSATGMNDNRMRLVSWDVRDLAGSMATIEIVDAESGAWGNIGVDHIVQSDQPGASAPLADQPDFGTLALGLLGDSDGALAAADVPLDGVPARIEFPPAPNATHDLAEVPSGRRLAGAVGRVWKLQPGEETRATFVLAWHFPTLPRGRFDRLVDAAKLQRWYATQFASAQAVVEYVRTHFTRLAGETRLWNRTWYDSTLPHWLLDRALQPLCCIATATCYRFSNGRFYGYEGTYCCDGTCTHVWHYAQALARIFPELERSTRERVDYGLAFHADTGALDYRGEYARHVAVDGQAGTILRMYREHQMSADGQLLERLWPRVKKSVEHLLARDANADGILDGEQYNTLDASWFGEIAWISSLYLAALRAGAAMARDVGDEPFAARCTTVADHGAKSMVARLYNGEYFIQRIDPARAGAVNTNDGCHIDQVLGQAWAHQVGLPRVLPPAETRSALQSLWKYSFTPDVGPYRRQNTAIPGGRWYAMPGEGGLLMCTWPKGGADKARGDGKSPFIGYFNECMTGFEYQVAAHMVWEGLVREGLAVTRMIHDRYAAARRNPWNDVECSDHYARAMASYGVFLAACGFEYHGPRGHLGFAPRIAPDDFRAPFTAAEGWGTFAQSRREGAQEVRITIVLGKLRFRTLTVDVANESGAIAAVAQVAGESQPVSVTRAGRRVTIAWERSLVIQAGQTLSIQLTLT